MEHDSMVLVVWSLLFSSIFNCGTHFVTYVVLYRQHSQTDIGRALAWRELSLAVKAGFRAIIDMMLVGLVVYNDYFVHDMNQRTIIFLSVSIATYASIILGVNYIIQLRAENWGKPEYQVREEAMNQRHVRQDAREVSQAFRSTKQDERSGRQNLREISQGERETRLDERENGGTA
jgi:hypothetical protein